MGFSYTSRDGQRVQVDVAYVWNFNGSATFHMRSGTAGYSGSEFVVRYVGPPLVSD